MTMKLHEI